MFSCRPCGDHIDRTRKHSPKYQRSWAHRQGRSAGTRCWAGAPILLRLFPLPFCFWSCSQCAIRVPLSFLDRLDCGILVATLCTRPLRLQHSGRHGTYSNAKTEHPKRTGRYSTASIGHPNRFDDYSTDTTAVVQSPRCILDRHRRHFNHTRAYVSALSAGLCSRRPLVRLDWAFQSPR